MTTATLTKKPKKVTTTVRFDSELKKQAEDFARANHMDFTTLLSFSLKNTMQYGGRIEPRISDERYAYYQKMAEDIDAGLVSPDQFSSIADMRNSYSL